LSIKNIWYLDRSCSNHITEDYEAFVNMDSSFVSKVKLGNGKCVEVKGKDNNGVTTKERGKVIHGTLYL